MRTIVISYSWTGNNDLVASSLATAFTAEHIKIAEEKPRTMGTVLLDMIFDRRIPKITMSQVNNIEEFDLVLFVGPVWLGHVASPFRACFKEYSTKIGRYAYVSISGGADGPNTKLEKGLKIRLGKPPVSLIDLHIADLLPPVPKPTRKVTMFYRLTEFNRKYLIDAIVPTLQKAL